ncbi:MAG: PAS domain S-box protein [Candidatus Thiodiazotropha taylori]
MGGLTAKEELEKRLAELRENSPPGAEEDESGLLHNLQVQQVELEMQNRELREAQAELELTRDHYADLYDFAPVGYLTLDGKGCVRECNLTATALLGEARQRLERNVPFGTYVAQPSKSAFFRHLADGCRRPGQAVAVEVTLQRRNGEPRRVRLDSASYVDEEAGETLCRTVMTDITELKQTQQEVEHGQAELASLLNAAPAGIGLVRDRVFQWVSTRFLAMLGYNEEELLGKNSRCIYPDGAEYERVGRDKYAQIRAEGVGEIETRLRRKDGTIIDVLLRSAPLNPDDLGQGSIFTALDISERKRFEEELRDSEQRFREVVENIQDVFWMTDPQSNQVFYINPAYEHVWGRSCESLYKNPRSFIDGVHPEDRPAFIREIENLAEGRYHDMEYRIVRPDGSERWLHDRAFPVHNANGEVYRVAGIIQDITQLHRSNTALRESEARFRSIFEHAAAGMATGTPDGQFSEVNPALANMLGYTPEELVGKTIREITHPDDWDANKDRINAVKEGKLSTYQLQKRYLKKDGTTLWVQLTSAWVRNSEGQPLFWVALQQDITELKQTEAALQRNNNELRTLLDSIPSPVYFVDRELRYQRVNQAFLDCLGMSEQQVIGKTGAELLPSTAAEGFMRGDRHVIENKQSHTEYEQAVPDASGRLRWFSTTKSPLTGPDGKAVGLVGICGEITELKRMAEQRVAKEQTLRETLIREVHHRIKNHLQGMLGMLRNLSMNCTQKTICMDKAVVQVRTIANIYGLQSQAGHEHLRIDELVQASANLYLETPNAKIDCRIEGVEVLRLAREEAVPVALVISELITNAVKHSAGGGPLRVEISLAQQSSRAVLRVTNPCENLPLGFDFAGAGMGLGLVRTLLPQQGAQLEFHQEPARVIAELSLQPPVIWQQESPANTANPEVTG